MGASESSSLQARTTPRLRRITRLPPHAKENWRAASGWGGANLGFLEIEHLRPAGCHSMQVLIVDHATWGLDLCVPLGPKLHV